MTILELANCTDHILGEIAEPSFTRRDIAQSCRLAMNSTEPTDWKCINAAIVRRWSLSGLDYIKRQAHSGACFTKK